MKAIVYYEYGPPEVLQYRDVDVPAVGDDAVLVRVRAAAANPLDWHFVRGEPYFMRMMSGRRAPRRHSLGVDFAGVVEAVGRNVTRCQPGAAVIGMCHGAFAEYLAAPAGEVAFKPSNVTFEQAAALPVAALTALQGIRDAGHVQRDQRVLVIGASGGVGTFAVQIAKLMGAHVTGVCSTRNVELVRGLGADRVIDYTRDDVIASNEKYDVIFQLAGMLSPLRLRRALVATGRLVLSSGDSKGRWIGPMGRVLGAIALSPFVSQRLRPLFMQRSTADLESLATLVEQGQLTPVIDRTYALTEVPDAIRHLETGRARGKIVIAV